MRSGSRNSSRCSLTTWSNAFIFSASKVKGQPKEDSDPATGNSHPYYLTRVLFAWLSGRLFPHRGKCPRNKLHRTDGIPCHAHRVDSDVNHMLCNQQSDYVACRNWRRTLHNTPPACIPGKTWLRKLSIALFVPDN